MVEPQISPIEWDTWVRDLDAVGLSVMGVMSPDQLPEHPQDHVRSHHPQAMQAKQWWVIGHHGDRLWRRLTRAYGVACMEDVVDLTHPMDMWVHRFLTQQIQCRSWPATLWVPDEAGEMGIAAPLQSIGQTLGWTHQTPFQLGIDGRWGTWFAYRAVICADIWAPLSAPMDRPSPCDACLTRPCETACPAGACTPQWDGNQCQSHRLSAVSSCRTDCLARRACPVGSEYAYSSEQMRDHSLPSLRFMAHQIQSKPHTP